MEKGANVVSPGAAQGWGHTMVFPSIVYPTNMDMRVMQEEQFGPLVSVGTFSSMEEISDYVKQSKYGQQAAVFTSSDVSNLGPLLDVLVG